MPTPRKLAMTGAGITAIGVAVLVVFTVLGSIRVADALILAGLGAVLGMLAFLVLMVRRLDGKALRIDGRAKKQEAKLQEMSRSLTTMAQRLETITQTVTKGAAQRDEDLQAVLASLGEDRVNAMFLRRELDSELRELRRRLDAKAARANAPLTESVER